MSPTRINGRSSDRPFFREIRSWRTCVPRRLGGLHRGVRFGHHRCVHFTQTGFVLGGVVTAEEKFSTGREHNTCASPCTAPVAPVRCCQLWAGQCSGHDSSVLACGLSRSPGAGPPRRYGAVRSLCQTYGGHALFPSAFLCVVTNTKHASRAGTS